MLKARLGERARRVPGREVPDWLVRAAAPFSAEARAVVPHLGVARQATSDKARRLLGWEPRPWAETVVDTAESLFALGAVRPG